MKKVIPMPLANVNITNNNTLFNSVILSWLFNKSKLKQFALGIKIYIWEYFFQRRNLNTVTIQWFPYSSKVAPGNLCEWTYKGALGYFKFSKET